MDLIRQVCVVLECLVRVVKETVHALEVPLHVLFHTLSLAFPLLPNLHFGLKVYEALLDQLDVQDAGHAILIVDEAFILALQQLERDLDAWVHLCD